MMYFVLTKKPQALLVLSISVIGYWVLTEASWLLILEINNNARPWYRASHIQMPYVLPHIVHGCNRVHNGIADKQLSGLMRSIQPGAGLSETGFVVCGV